MRTDSLPGLYLYRTRQGTLRALVSYLWLEIAPWVACLWWLIGAPALIVVPAHYAFIGLYEVGYLFNDGATTKAERNSRPHVEVRSPLLFTAVRLALLALAAFLISEHLSQRRALLFLGAAFAVLALSMFHTLVGVRVRRSSPLRWSTFSLLAWLKYLPAVLACVPAANAVLLLAGFFLLYGGGRVVEYAIDKHGGSVIGHVDVNAAWFICGLPIVVSSAVNDQLTLSMLPAAATLGLHHAIAYLVRRAHT